MSENGASCCSNESSWYEAILSQASPSGLLELHRRCFSCCNVVLRQEATLVQSHERMMLLEQPMFTEHVMMKAIMARVSDQMYKDIRTFVDDITKLVETCVAECDRCAVLGALMTHVAKIGQPDYTRPSRTTFHGFPRPLLEEMLAQATAARKKMPPSRTHVTVDVGRSLARSYGLGLASGARFIGQPSEEKAFYAQRKEREIERANAISAETAAAALKAQKRNKTKEKGVEGAKRKQKLQSPVFNAAVTPKPTRSLRATRRMATEDSADELTRPDTPTGVAAGTAARSSDVASRKRKASGIPQRFLKRERVHCPHQQGAEVEMCDEEWEGNGYTGTIRGTGVVCHCGCETTMKGVHWLHHNGGRPNNRHPGYPWKYMRLVATNKKLADHWLECDCHEHLCDSCHSWEEPGFPMVACSKCGTSVHAAEGCATPIVRPTEKKSAAPESTDDVDPGATAEASPAAAAAAGDDVAMPPPSAKARSRSVRRKGPVRSKADAAGSDACIDSGGSLRKSVDGGEAEDPRAGEWVCQICSGARTEKERFSTIRRQKPGVRLAAS
ncbi:unnamed protein product [Pylaiella littoralis]